MGVRKPVSVGEHVFSSKEEAWRFFSEMLNRYGRLERVRAEDEPALRSLFERHLRAEHKLEGHSISHFEVHPAEGGTQCFCVIRTDGKRVDFSIRKCI